MKTANEPQLGFKSLKCRARTRGGEHCPNFAQKNGKCRRHGGLSTGPVTAEGLERSRKANWKNGVFSAVRMAKRRRVNRLYRECISLGQGAIKTYRGLLKDDWVLGSPAMLGLALYMRKNNLSIEDLRAMGMLDLYL